MLTSCFPTRGLAILASMVLAPANRIVALLLILVTPTSAQMLLVAESRSVTVSYYGSGVGTESSDGNFGIFEGDAVGIPFGGGFMIARQKSNITPSEISIAHYLDDYYGPGGFAVSSFNLQFRLLDYTRMTITGYCSNFSGSISLGSELASIPLVWHGSEPYYNYLDFDQVLAPGLYNLSSFETPRDAVSTQFLIKASAVPDGGGSWVVFGIALLGLLGARRWLS